LSALSTIRVAEGIVAPLAEGDVTLAVVVVVVAPVPVLLPAVVVVVLLPGVVGVVLVLGAAVLVESGTAAAWLSDELPPHAASKEAAPINATNGAQRVDRMAMVVCSVFNLIRSDL
jgi:hypothetical protein